MVNVDLTGARQHGFNRKRSTSTAGLEIQSEITRALDSNKFTLMASLDLTSVFDIVKCAGIKPYLDCMSDSWDFWQ